MSRITLREVTWRNADTGDDGVASGLNSWSAQVPLAAGLNLIQVTATDLWGRQGRDSLDVLCDQQPPVVSIETPTTASRYVATAPFVAMGGTASDNDRVITVTWQNHATGAAGPVTGLSVWTASVPLVPGVNLITVSAQDTVWNVGSDSIQVVLATGRVQAWGANGNSQLGNGRPLMRMVPVEVLNPADPSGLLTDVVSSEAAEGFTVVLHGDGTVSSWGVNLAGQLGDGTDERRFTPVKVVDPEDPSGYLSGVVSIASGASHTLALLGDGTVRSWGFNGDGQLGVGNRFSRYWATRVEDPTDPSGALSGVAAVAAGKSHSLALLVDGTLRAWGSNDQGQLGGGAMIRSVLPVPVSDPSDPSGLLTGGAAVAAGTYESLALLADGTVRGWGRNASGQLGDGTEEMRLAPVAMVDPSDPSGLLTGAVAIASGAWHSLVLRGDGSMRACGWNGNGALGDGTTIDRRFPTAVIDLADPSGLLSGVAGIAGGEDYSLALLGDGTVRSWGRNVSAQLGDGTLQDRLAPARVADPSDPTGHLSGVAGISAGRLHTLAVLGDGTLRGWGSNRRGELSDGNPLLHTEPVDVMDPSAPSGHLEGALALAVSDYTTVALLSDGTVRAWGEGYYGQLGNGSRTSSGIPGRVVDPGDLTGYLTGVVSIASRGTGHTLALRDNGTVRAWGVGWDGQLGDGFRSWRSEPVQVVDPSDPSGFLRGVAAVSAGSYSSHAVMRNGTVRAWGANWRGQLGDGTDLDRLTPVAVVDPSDPSGYLTGVAQLEGQSYHTVALMVDGTVRTWGWNEYGQLGDGTRVDTFEPVQVVDPADPSGYLVGATAVAAGTCHTMALMADGTVRAWGANWYGQLGTGKTYSERTPATVVDPLDPAGILNGVVAVAAGDDHSVALKADGTVRAWGRNDSGQLGDGTTLESLVPIRVVDPDDPSGYLTGVADIAAGGQHTLTLH